MTHPRPKVTSKTRLADKICGNLVLRGSTWQVKMGRHMLRSREWLWHSVTALRYGKSTAREEPTLLECIHEFSGVTGPKHQRENRAPTSNYIKMTDY